MIFISFAGTCMELVGLALWHGVKRALVDGKRPGGSVQLIPMRAVVEKEVNIEA